MKTMPRWWMAWAMLGVASVRGQDGSLPGTGPLEGMAPADRSSAMVAGIGRFLDRQGEKAVEERPMRWARDFTNRGAYERSVAPQRERLAK